jgi:4'-phosphopantetheinyl transferase
MTSVRPLWEDGPISVISALLDSEEPLDHLLSGAELDRAGRFKFSRHRHRFVTARSLLRRQLAERTGVPPRDLVFATNDFGKPHLVGHPHVAFNVSHSADQALLAFASDCEIGIDVEHLRPLDALTLAQSYFSEPERRELGELPPSLRLQAFFDGWVRKEAVIKADGRGMSMPLDSFSVRLMGGPRLYVSPPDQPAGTTWEMHSVDVGAPARAAVALRKPSLVTVPTPGYRPDSLLAGAP